MNRDDVICLIEMLGRYRPDYAQWRSDQAHELAARYGTEPAVEQEAMIDSACRTLASIDAVEAADVLEQIETGQLPLPQTPRGFMQWERLVEVIRASVLDDRRRRREADKFDREQSPRFHCLDCLDAGSVLVYYPPFLEWLRPTFAEYERSGFPPGWFAAESRRWYRRLMLKEVKAPATLPLACRCASPAAKVYQAQVAKLRDQVRATGAGRAAHVGVWNPERQCRVVGDERVDLALWYASHEPNESFTWQADPMQYVGNGGFEDE